MILASVSLDPAGGKKNTKKKQKTYTNVSHDLKGSGCTNKDAAEGQDGRPGRLNCQRKEANTPTLSVLCSGLNKPGKGTALHS